MDENKKKDLLAFLCEFLDKEEALFLLSCQENAITAHRNKLELMQRLQQKSYRDPELEELRDSITELAGSCVATDEWNQFLALTLLKVVERHKQAIESLLRKGKEPDDSH